MKEFKIFTFIFSCFIGFIISIVLNKFNLLPISITDTIKNNKGKCVLISFCLIILMGILCNILNINNIIFILFVGIFCGMLTLLINT